MREERSEEGRAGGALFAYHFRARISPLLPPPLPLTPPQPFRLRLPRMAGEGRSPLLFLAWSGPPASVLFFLPQPMRKEEEEKPLPFSYLPGPIKTRGRRTDAREEGGGRGENKKISCVVVVVAEKSRRNAVGVVDFFSPSPWKWFQAAPPSGRVHTNQSEDPKEASFLSGQIVVVSFLPGHSIPLLFHRTD